MTPGTPSETSQPDTGDEVETFDWLRQQPDSAASYAGSIHALELDQLLWRGFEDRVLPRLRQLLQHGPEAEKAAAAWVLARWHASQQDLEPAHRAILTYHSLRHCVSAIAHPGPYLLGVELCATVGDTQNAQAILQAGIAAFGEEPDFVLARFLLAKAEKQSEEELSAILGGLYLRSGLTPLTLSHGDAPIFDRLSPETTRSIVGPDSNLPLVSVIVPVFNAAEVLPTAVRSLLAQSWMELEVLLVDDGSTDDSVEIARAFAAQDSRVRVIELGRNQGAYRARNAGFAEARGVFVTVHDADDWSHPQKIEKQARALLENGSLKASVSHWMRAGDGLEMTRWRMEESWTHRNVSSLMVRAELRNELGYWDRARVNADTEYYYRILHAYGSGAIREVCPGIPLAFGRTMQESLTNLGATHLRTQFKGVRHDYMEAAHHWHSQAKRPADLFLSHHPTQRPFRIPPEAAIGDPEGPAGDYDLLVASDLLDADWYALAYPDVMQAGIGAARHYLATGAAEGRDPGPRFSSSGYRHVKGLGRDVNPLVHHLRYGEGADSDHLPTFAGKLSASMAGCERVLVFAHTSGATLFGAERSFLDMVQRISRDGFAPVVVLPSLQNPDYLERLIEISAAVEVLPQRWRHGLHPPEPETVEAIRALIRKYLPCEMHVNTLTQEAPVIAARKEGVPSVMYVREMPGEDDALCRMLGIGPEALRRSLLDQVDRFVMPSQAVADWLQCPDRCTVRPNAVDEKLFDLPFSPRRILKVGLISSNITKKGIGDFALAAQMVAALGPAVRFLLIGPQTPDLRFLQPLPHNLQICDYTATPNEAIAQIDVLVSLSHFAESFGRTVVEAMAAGRPVICYDRGAPPSLVIGGETGIVVPADCVESVVDAVMALDTARLQLGKMSLAARKRARAIQDQALA